MLYQTDTHVNVQVVSLTW